MARKPKVNIVGVNGLGAVTGLHPAVGAGVSATLGTGLAIGLRRAKKNEPNSKLHKYSELIGGGAALAASAAMMASPRWRAAGFTGVVVAVLNNGLRFLERQMSKDTAAGGMGIVSPEQVPTLGAYAAERMPLAGGGMGAVTAQQRSTLGAVQAESRQLAGNGLPTFQGTSLGQHFGATCVG